MKAQELADDLDPLLAGRTIRTITRDGQNIEMVVHHVDTLPTYLRQPGQGNVIISDAAVNGLTLRARDVAKVEKHGNEVHIIRKDTKRNAVLLIVKEAQ